jgi:hypothetical protein
MRIHATSFKPIKNQEISYFFEDNLIQNKYFVPLFRATMTAA